jgi:hypothetical protein
LSVFKEKIVRNVFDFGEDESKMSCCALYCCVCDITLHAHSTALVCTCCADNEPIATGVFRYRPEMRLCASCYTVHSHGPLCLAMIADDQNYDIYAKACLFYEIAFQIGGVPVNQNTKAIAVKEGKYSEAVASCNVALRQLMFQDVDFLNQVFSVPAWARYGWAYMFGTMTARADAHKNGRAWFPDVYPDSDVKAEVSFLSQSQSEAVQSKERKRQLCQITEGGLPLCLSGNILLK